MYQCKYRAKIGCLNYNSSSADDLREIGLSVIAHADYNVQGLLRVTWDFVDHETGQRFSSNGPSDVHALDSIRIRILMMCEEDTPTPINVPYVQNRINAAKYRQRVGDLTLGTYIPEDAEVSEKTRVLPIWYSKIDKADLPKVEVDYDKIVHSFPVPMRGSSIKKHIEIICDRIHEKNLEGFMYVIPIDDNEESLNDHIELIANVHKDLVEIIKHFVEKEILSPQAPQAVLTMRYLDRGLFNLNHSERDQYLNAGINVIHLVPGRGWFAIGADMWYKSCESVEFIFATPMLEKDIALANMALESIVEKNSKPIEDKE